MGSTRLPVGLEATTQLQGLAWRPPGVTVSQQIIQVPAGGGGGGRGGGSGGQGMNSQSVGARVERAAAE